MIFAISADANANSAETENAGNNCDDKKRQSPTEHDTLHSYQGAGLTRSPFKTQASIRKFPLGQALRRLSVAAAFLADADLCTAGREADALPPSFPPLRAGA